MPVMQTRASHIIEQFGGVSALARALGHRWPTTVQGWKNRGIIPAHAQQDVLDAAERRNVPLSPADFFSPASGRVA